MRIDQYAWAKQKSTRKSGARAQWQYRCHVSLVGTLSYRLTDTGTGYEIECMVYSENRYPIWHEAAIKASTEQDACDRVHAIGDLLSARFGREMHLPRRKKNERV